MKNYKVVRSMALEYATRKVDRFGTWEHIADISRHEIRVTSHRNTLPVDWERIRRLVIQRAGGRCERCGEKAEHLHVHHIIHRSRGGTNELTNLWAVCPKCHSELHPENAQLRAMAERQMPSERRVQLRDWVRGYVGGGSE